MLGALLFAMAMSLLAGQSAGATPTDNSSSQPLVPVLIKFHSNASAADIDDAIHGNGGIVTNDLKQIRTKVVHVPANARDRILAALAKHPAVERATAPIKLSRAGTPSDPAYSQQWALPKIAWDQAYGNVAISGHATIAVLDTGIDATHPDLTGRVVAGASFTGGDPNTDPNGHGTALAGIAAANVNDGIGMAGVAYAGTDLSSVQVLQADGTGYDSDVVAGVLWAADNGASVILMGFSSADYSFALADAIAYAWGRGAVLIAATGNDGSSGYTYPAGTPYVVGVAATDQDDVAASSSNTGSALIGAPGVGIYTTQPGGAYATFSGTSAAAAHAAGLAALLRASGSDNSAIASKLRTGADATGVLPRMNVANSFAADASLPAPAGTPAGGVPNPIYTAAAMKYTAAISAAGLGGGATTVAYTLTITNNSTNNEVLGSSNVTIPAGYSSLVLGSVTVSAGKVWTATLVGGTIQLRSSAANTLTPGQSVTLGFTATNPCTAVTYQWNGDGKQTVDYSGGGASNFDSSSTNTVTVSNNCYEASITPTTATAGAASFTYTLTITNRSSTSLGSASATAPAGYLSVVLGTVAGPGSKGWTASLASGVIQLRATNNQARLDLNESVSAIFSATNPATVGSYAWTTTSKTTTDFSGTTTFALRPGTTDPTVAITAGAAARLRLVQQPTSATYGNTIGPSVTVEIVDANNNRITNDNSTQVSLSLGTNPTGASLSGGGAQAASSGLATFGGLSINKVGTGYTLAASSNPSLTGATSPAFDITARAITVTATADSRTYNGTNNSSGVPAMTSGSLASGDTASLTQTFDSRNVGTTRVITPAISFTSGSVSNYALTLVTKTNQTITPRALTVSASGLNRVYDGTTAATVTLSDNRVSGDVFTGGFTTAAFNNKNVGIGKAVSVSGISISGTDAGNYTFNTTALTSADITPRALTITAAGVNKVYDSTTAATVTLSDNRVSGDVFTDSYTAAAFADKNVANGNTVSVSGISISGTDAANYALANTTATTTANITARALTVSAHGINKIYDGGTTATVTLSDDRVSGDVFTDTYTTATFADKNVASGKTVTVSGISISGTDAANYTFNTTASTTAEITARTLHLSATGVNKIYDGTTAATVTLSDDRVAGDIVADSHTAAAFADKNVTNGKTVSVSGIAISGTDARNYTFNTTATTTADITARGLTVSAHGINKVYDGGTTATVTLSDDRVSGDVFTDSYTAASFADKNVGTAKAVSVSGISIAGTDASNYTFNTTATTTADITTRTLHVTATGVNKVYDGTTTATATLSDDRVAGDVFGGSYTLASFADKNVGTAKTVSVSGISISGTDAANYAFNTSASTSADITARTLHVSATGLSNVYDGTTAATVTLSDDRMSGDILADSYTAAAFADKNVANGKTVSVSGVAISGTDAGNYTFNTTASTSADITARTLHVSVTGVNKVYDGTTTATVTLSDDRVAGDVFSTSYSSASFADKNVGTGKAVAVSGISISGTDAGNYTFNNTASASADIAARTLHVSATGVNRVYDGSTAAAATLSDDRVSGDVFSTSSAAASFADKNVGTAKTVSVSGISISGTDAPNYTFNATATTTADITPRGLTVSAHGINKVYDGTTTATVTLSDDRVAGDVFSTSYTLAGFADKNVGTGKAVAVSGISISGTDAANYTFNTTASTTADITARALDISATSDSKTYDGTTSSSAAPTTSGLQTGDTVSGLTQAFQSKNVLGTNGSTLQVTGYTVNDGNAGHNYTVTTLTATGTIGPKDVSGSFTAQSRIYDGATAATVLTRSLNGTIGSDDVALSGGTASFADKNVGTAKTVTLTGAALSGSDAANYHLTGVATTTADINARALHISATAVNKIYDGTTTATVTLSDDRVSGDVFTDGFTSATFNNKNVGTGKTVSVSGISISGTDAGNYTFNTTATASADITARTLHVTATGVNKVYDGGTTATVTLSDDRVSGDVFADTYTGATFNNKNVGTGKAVAVSGISISGTDAGNYTFNTTALTSADINARGLTVSAHGINKTYDGTTAATVTLSDDRVAGDVFSTSYTSATFADKNVGMAKAVSVSGIVISGADAANYTFNTTATTTANITPRALTVSAQGINKVYDGTTAATVTLSDNRVAGDVFSTSYAAASFADKNVGTAKAVAVSDISISGTDAGNYTFNITATTTADISARALTVSAQGISKIYDGTTAATVTLSDNRVAGDVFSTSYAGAAFNNKNVGTGKAVAVSGISISGTDAANYIFNATASTSADIAVRALTVSAVGVSRVYDGTTAATVTLSDNRVSGDVFTDSYTSATFANKNVGAAKTVSVSGISISGTDAANYTFNATATTTADITAKPAAATFTANNKVYDGNATASFLTRTIASKVNGDGLDFSASSLSFASKNVSTGKTVTASGIALTGTDKDNYALSSTTAATTADITARALTLSATGVNKTYDGTTAATVTLSDNRVSGDVFTRGYTSATFANKNVATTKTVSVSGISISGTDAANYTFNITATTTADITARLLHVGATGTNKIYDGTTAAAVMLSDDRVSGDVVSTSYTAASFADKNVGTAKAVSVSGTSIAGTDAANYSLANTSAATTANITRRDLTVTATGMNKVYDGATVVTVTLTDNRVAGDVFTDSYTAASFADKNVGTGKAVSVSGISIAGTDAANYNLTNTTAATTANVTRRPITVTADAGQTKVYGNADPLSFTYHITSGSLALGDTFSGALSRAAGENVGVYAIGQGTVALSSNYTLTYVGANFSITKATLTITADSKSRQYSDPNPTFTATYTGFKNGDTPPLNDLTGSPSLTTTANSASNVGTYTITAALGTLASGNYSLAFVNGTLTVTQEDARDTYTGPTFAATASATSGTVTLTLRATIQDITAVTGDTAYDAFAGDIRTATVKFVNRDSANALLCTASLALISQSDTKTATATCNWSASLGSADSAQYTVGIMVGGNYFRDDSSEDAVVTVSKPLTNFITGGGYLVESSSSGTISGDLGTRSNFGFNVKFNQSGTNLQGHVNVIVRHGGRVYQIKSTSITSLGVQPLPCINAPCTAQFVAKASVQDITNPLLPISVEGNATIQMNMHDQGEPGSSDTIGFTVYDKNNALMFSSNWTGATTAEQLLAGGNVVVH